MNTSTNNNCKICGCGLHPITGECSHCQAKANVELELGIKLPDEVICPYCNGTGKYEKWHNHYTGEIEQEKCDACNGSRWCDRELASHYVKEENEPTR